MKLLLKNMLIVAACFIVVVLFFGSVAIAPLLSHHLDNSNYLLLLIPVIIFWVGLFITVFEYPELEFWDDFEKKMNNYFEDSEINNDVKPKHRTPKMQNPPPPPKKSTFQDKLDKKMLEAERQKRLKTIEEAGEVLKSFESPKAYKEHWLGEMTKEMRHNEINFTVKSIIYQADKLEVLINKKS